jgi:hypothetical protein
MKLSIGKEYKMKFPFHKHEANPHWWPGCHLYEEREEYYTNRFFTANGEGEVIYKILSFSEMPERYKDRVIFKRWTVDPDGKKYSNGEVRMLTNDLFIKDVESVTPFRQDYEVESA